MADELRIPLGYTPDHSTAPVMATDNDARETQLLADSSHSIGMSFETKVLEVGGCALLA